MSELILVRHGETAKNAQGVMHGSQDAEVLNEKGVEQIHQTAQKLKDFSPVKIYTSDEPRASQSGELIAQELGISCEKVEGFQERNWGEFSGKPWAEVQAVLSPMSLEERFAYVPPGGESWQQFESRLIHALSIVLEKHANEPVAIVCHGGSIRALIPHLLGVAREESFKYDPDNASLTVFAHANGSYSPVTINDISHLTI